MIATAVVVIWYFYSGDSIISVVSGNLTVAKVNINKKELIVFDSNNKAAVKISLDSFDQVGSLSSLQQCNSTKNKCLKWVLSKSSLTVSAHQFNNIADQSTMHCTKIKWKTNVRHIPKDCIHLSNPLSNLPTVWFSSSHDYVFWHNRTDGVINKSDICLPFIPGGYSIVSPFGKLIKNYGGNVIEPTLFSSQGAAVKASTHHAVKVCRKHSSDPLLCMEPMFDESHHDKLHYEDGYHLDYVVCIAQSLPAVYENMMREFIKPKKSSIDQLPHSLIDMVNDGVYFESKVLPSSPPTISSSLTSDCKSLIEKPLWNVMGENIEVSFNASNLVHLKEIGGTCHLKNFSSLYANLGDFQFDNHNRNIGGKILASTRKMGLKLMLPITPFINFDSSNFAQAAFHKYLIRNDITDAPFLISFDMNKQQFPAIIDLTSPNASAWFKLQISKLKSHTNDSFFHFYFGQSTWLPQSTYILSHPLHNIGHFSTLFADLAYGVNRCSITDVAYDSQNLNQFVLLSPFPTMKETLAAVLAAGIGGYPFVVANFPCPLREALQFMEPGVLRDGIIRWVEMVSFFPVVHIPWDYETLHKIDETLPGLVVNLTRTYMEVRNSPEVASKLRKAFLNAEINGSKPVLTPMWMAPGALSSSNLERLLLVDDQFMIGDDMFVAPILDSGTTNRTIYIPPGRWKDVVNHNDTTSRTEGRWQDYKIELMKIAVFVRSNSLT